MACKCADVLLRPPAALQVAEMVERMMAGKHKPGRLQRVGATLYRRMASLDPTQVRLAARGLCMDGAYAYTCIHMQP